MALPLTISSVAVGLLAVGGVSTLPAFANDIRFVLAPLFLGISFIGMGMLLYIVNLRMDALLYARTVNAIRKYFYDNGVSAKVIDFDRSLRTRVLPQSFGAPRFKEYSYFIPVVFSFGIFNSVYFALGLLISFTRITDITLSSFTSWMALLTILFFGVHFFSYQKLSSYREHSYLRSYTIGVDVDGVLNNHRSKFSELLRELTGKVLLPEEMTALPLHEMPNSVVKKADEEAVFNDIRYWAEMPELTEASESLRRLRDNLRIRIHIFTYRPWPTRNQRTGAFLVKWRDAALKEVREARKVPNLSLKQDLHNLFDLVRLGLPFESFWPNPLGVITRCWLLRKGVPFDHLLVERGYDDMFEPEARLRNRFNLASQNHFRFFVEDDLEKATKLAYICDVVFLLDMPYNQSKSLPSNVLRVSSWDEIYKSIRKLS